MCKHDELHRGVIVYTEDGIAGRIVAFWESDGQIVIEMDAYHRVEGHTQLRDERQVSKVFVDEECVVDACVRMYADGPRVIRLCVPPVAIL